MYRVENKVIGVNMSKEKLKSLDGIKGFAIWFIVLYHTLGHFGSTYPSFLAPIKKYGGLLGNSFFFMISGFTICYVYKDYVLEHSVKFKQFVGRRIRKIYPCYLISTLACVCMFTTIYDGKSSFTLTELMLNLFMLTSGWINDSWAFNYPCWFVSQLLLCYVIWYIVTYFLNKNCVYGYVILVGVGYMLCSFPLSIPFCYSNDGIGFLNFFMGCLVYEFYAAYAHRFKKAVSIIGMASILCILYTAFQSGFEAFVDAPESLLAFIVCPAGILAVLEVDFLKFMLGNRIVAAMIGDISMAVFFWHVPIMAALVIVRNKLQLLQGKGNLYYILSLLVLFLFSHVVIKLRMLLDPKVDALLNKVNHFASVQK